MIENLSSENFIGLTICLIKLHFLIYKSHKKDNSLRRTTIFILILTKNLSFSVDFLKK